MEHWAGIPSWLCVAFAFLLGAILGSFVNAAVHRLPRDISLLTRTRSFCPQCEAQLAWYDNIPILSFLWLGGRCRSCGRRIPARYLIVELLAASLFALSAYQFFVLNVPAGPGLASRMPLVLMVVQMFLAADLLCAAFTDLETWYIPLQTTWPWTILGLLLAPVCPELHMSRTEWLPEPVGEALWAARGNALFDSVQGLVFGAGIPWFIGFVCIVFLGKEGMASGDSHLLGMLGAVLGWKPALAIFFLGIFIGCFLGLGTLAWDRLQQARLGARWQPRRPTFELNDAELAAGPPPAWPLLAAGAFVLAFEGLLFWLCERNPLALEAPGLGSPVVGALLGAALLAAYPIHRRLAQTDAWPRGEVRTRADGKQEEVLEGNYIPFGPSLALAGVLVVFYDPLLRALAERWFYALPTWPALPFRVPGVPL